MTVFEWPVLDVAHRRYPRPVDDFDALEAAGIAFEAESRGRLFGLAGDVLQRSGRPTYSIPTAADALGVPAEDVEHAWALRGLTVASPDHLALSQADVDGLAAWLKMKAFLAPKAHSAR